MDGPAEAAGDAVGGLPPEAIHVEQRRQHEGEQETEQHAKGISDAFAIGQVERFGDKVFGVEVGFELRGLRARGKLDRFLESQVSGFPVSRVFNHCG